MDPFEISQYATSFSRQDTFQANPFGFADLDLAIFVVAEAIVLRQTAISIAFGTTLTVFTNVEDYNVSTPTGIITAVEKFQTAVTEFVEGPIIDEFGTPSGCIGSPYIGFFHFANGNNIIGLGNILPSGVEWTDIPAESEASDPAEFARSIADNLNEIIIALNALIHLHSPFIMDYPFKDECVPAPKAPIPQPPPDIPVERLPPPMFPPAPPPPPPTGPTGPIPAPPPSSGFSPDQPPTIPKPEDDDDRPPCPGCTVQSPPNPPSPTAGPFNAYTFIPDDPIYRGFGIYNL